MTAPKRTPRGTAAPFGSRWSALTAQDDDWSREAHAGIEAFDSTLPGETIPTPAPGADRPLTDGRRFNYK